MLSPMYRLSAIQQKFEQASNMAGEEFFRKLDFYVNAWIPARELVKSAIDERFEVDSSGQIMVFNQASGEVRGRANLRRSNLAYLMFWLVQRNTVDALEGPLLRSRRADQARKGDPVRPLPRELGKARGQVEDPVCLGPSGQFQEQEGYARCVSRAGWISTYKPLLMWCIGRG